MGPRNGAGAKEGLWSSLTKAFKKKPKERPQMPWRSNFEPARGFQQHHPQTAPQTMDQGYHPYVSDYADRHQSLRPLDPSRDFLPENQVSQIPSGATYRYRGVDSRSALYSKPGHTCPHQPQGTQDPEVGELDHDYDREGRYLHTPCRSSEDNGGTQRPSVEEWVRSYTDQRDRHLQTLPGSSEDNEKKDPFVDFSWSGSMEEERSSQTSPQDDHPENGSSPDSPIERPAMTYQGRGRREHEESPSSTRDPGLRPSRSEQ